MSKEGKPKRPTSYDVARLAGVSQATVSLVLSQKSAKAGISPDTEQRVIEVARQLRYFPNSVIRSVQRGRTGIIGVYGRDHRWNLNQGYWIEALSSFHLAAADLEVELLMFSDPPKLNHDRLLERMLNGLCDGIVVQPGEDNRILDDLVAARIPLVCIGDAYREVPTVAVDSIGGITSLVSHLAEKGHRHLAMLNLERSEYGSPLLRERIFLESTAKLGLDASPKSVFKVEPPEIPAAIDAILAMSPAPTAVVCFNDEWAYHALRYCLSKGIDVPGRLAITGFDGIPIPLVPRQVTTVRSPIRSMCRLALQMLLKLVDGEPVESATLPVELLVGETS